MKVGRVLLMSVLVAAAACSKGSPERSTMASPTSPSTVATGALGGGLAGPQDVAFPTRSDAFDFRQQLETKYSTTLSRAAAPTFVDAEGEVVWLEEYIRLRVNGCDHATASQRVLAEIDGTPASICQTTFTSETAVFPSRADIVDFRQQLETKYQAFGRAPSSTAVDAEGAAVWLSEYLRYRNSSCDHGTAVQKVFTQIDGGAVPATCTPVCSYHLFNAQASFTSASSSGSAELLKDSGSSSCTWTAISQDSWITLTAPTTGGDRELQNYTVAANTGGPRTGHIRFNFPGGAVSQEVNQSASPFNLSFTFLDPAKSGSSPVTECEIRSASTICTLSSTTNSLPQAVATYDWTVTYSYGGSRTRTQKSSASTFSFTESCGASESSGTVVPISVTLTATDTAGNAMTIYSGQGFQPALQLRTFNCP